MTRQHDCRVLVLDTDYQRGGLTCRLIPEMLEDFRLGEVTDTTLYVAYRTLYTGTEGIPDLTVLETPVGIDLVPADPRLSAISVDKMPPSRNLRDGNRMLLRHLMLVRESITPLLEGYDYVLIDSHPDLHDLEKSVICASDYIVSPVKLDQQSSVGVPSTVEAVNDINEDIESALTPIGDERERAPTRFAGAVGMMCREYGETLKYSEQVIYNRLRRSTGIFDSYVTEGDGLRQAAQNSCPVYDVQLANAQKQSQQFQAVTQELIDAVTHRSD